MRPSRRFLLVVALLLLVSARVAYVARFHDDPLFDHPVVDAQVYDSLARDVAEGRGYPLPVYASNPFYPYLVGLFYRLFGPATLPVVLFQHLLGIGCGLLLFAVGRRLGGFPAGLVALLLGGLYRPALFYEAFLLPTTAGVFVNLLLLRLLLGAGKDRSPGALFLPGLLIGLGTLIQGNLLLFLPLAIGWILFRRPRRGNRIAAGFLVAGFLVAVLPVTARNAIRGKDLVLVSSHGGVNFYMGNNGSAAGVFSFPDEEIVLTPEHINVYDSKRIAEHAAGRSLKPSQVSWYWTRRGLSWIAGAPGRYLSLLGRKAVLFWNDLEIPDNADLYFFLGRVPALACAPFVFGVVAPLGLVGCFVLIAGRRGAPVLLFLAAQFVSALVFYTHSRYRIPFAVTFTLPAALGAVTAARVFRRHGAAHRVWLAALLLFLFVLVHYDPLGPGRPILRAYSVTHLAGALAEMGEAREAESAYREALRILPEHATAHYGLGRLYQSEGRLEEAVASYRAAVRAIPSFAEAYLNLGAAYHALGQDRKAVAEVREAIRLRPEWAEARYNLGNVLFDLGRYDEAVEQYTAARENGMTGSLLVRNVSNALERANRLADAEEVVRRGLGEGGNDADLRNRLGDLLEKMGRPDEAMAEYEEAVRIDPRHSVAWNNIGLLHYHRGEIDEAIGVWKKILAYDPKSPVVQNVRMAEEALGREENR